MNEMRKKFEQLRFFQEILEAKRLSKSEVDEFTKDYKREIRGDIKRGWKRARAIEVFDKYEIQSIDGESSTLIYKVESDSREEVEEYLKDEVVTITSQFDCTGRWFTTDIRFAHLQDRTYLVSHTKRRDI